MFEQLFNNFFHDQSNQTEDRSFYKDNFYYGSETLKRDEHYYRESNYYRDNQF